MAWKTKLFVPLQYSNYFFESYFYQNFYDILQAKSDEDFKSMYKLFLEKGPSAIDIEIRALGKEGRHLICLY